MVFLEQGTDVDGEEGYACVVQGRGRPHLTIEKSDVERQEGDPGSLRLGPSRYHLGLGTPLWTGVARKPRSHDRTSAFPLSGGTP